MLERESERVRARVRERCEIEGERETSVSQPWMDGGGGGGGGDESLSDASATQSIRTGHDPTLPFSGGSLCVVLWVWYSLFVACVGVFVRLSLCVLTGAQDTDRSLGVCPSVIKFKVHVCVCVCLCVWPLRRVGTDGSTKEPHYRDFAASNSSIEGFSHQAVLVSIQCWANHGG